MRTDKLTTRRQLKGRIDLHCLSHGLKLDYDAFTEMAQAKASIASMARTFRVTEMTMAKWLKVYRGDMEP